MALYLKLYQDLYGVDAESFRLLGKCLARGWHHLLVKGGRKEVRRIIDQT